MERITGKYYIETPYPLEKAAQVLAGEQSSGTFVAVPGETEELKARFAARVEKIEHLESVNEPAMPGAVAKEGGYHRANIEVSWSVENFGYNLPVLVSTLQGNLYELTQFTGLKLMDIEIPDSYTQHYKGPEFGIEGCRKLTGVEGRPLIGTIIKPSIGMSPETTAELVKTLAEAGIDFVKDDELMSAAANSSFEDRVDAIMRVINDHADRTGKKVMYAFNLSDEVDSMLRRYEYIVKAGGTCAMVSLNSVGLSGAKKICDQGALAIHGHRNGWGMMNRHPLLGIEFPAYQKLWRLAGVDQIHVNGIKNKFWESDDSVVRSIEACLKPLANGTTVLPVVSSGQWGGQAFETYRRTQTIDLLYMAGGGIMAHPDGPTGGVVALHQAWQGAVDGLLLEQAAEKYPEFANSVKKFGNS
ncbi:ribulose-bisphosphate carboxylase large subunit family protein [Mucilaginibacter daejeonensis]|uniref:ribulose-bisphosphate carboxylase large subunit family protein n=1 Tax=Mucilaginibacter daejeonensis TaxID=398049 RepID=UPI001D17B362|nr:ribulose-bisphosphate carboxylase large subunit family protein [Mucilaginibacter daejeonensis]UEG51536.1 ribulose-bisphosphate carboxylase large subunit family protein [Mucilaginibacter daejeonensis]